MCGKEAQAFNFEEFGNLLKKKWNCKRKIEKISEDELVARMIKFCPRCGSPNINALVFYRPSIWRCLDCGYQGTFIIQDSALPEKIQKNRERP
jgi:ribosomal protein L37AE/L43A